MEINNMELITVECASLSIGFYHILSMILIVIYNYYI